jgi:parvulin-like peptidyl-prolyl isomerase
LEPLINEKLRINAAYDLGIENDEEFKKLLDSQKMQMMGGTYYEQKIIDEVVPESEVEKTLIRQGVELKASHILIGFKGAKSKSDRTREEAEKLVADIIKELKAGGDFSTAAQKYSDDPSAKKNNGELGYFTWGRMVGPFQEAAWELEIGEISDPVETTFGFHIIKLDDRKEVPNYNPDRSKRNIFRLKQNLSKAYADTIRVHWAKHFEFLKKKYHYTLYDDSIKYVSNMVGEFSKVQKILPGSFTSEQKEITLAEYVGGKITLGSLIERHKDKLVSAFGKFRAAPALKQEIEGITMNKLVMLAVEEEGIDDLPEIRKQIKSFSEVQMNKMVEKRAIEGLVNPTDEEVKNYYKLNREVFKKEAEIEIWEVYMTDQKVAERVAQQAKQGADFKGLSDKYSVDKMVKNKGGYLGFKNVNGRGTVSREAHKLGAGGKIGGPVRYRRGWAVFKTGEERYGGVMDFEQAKIRAKNLVKKEQTLQAKNEWEASLKEKYSINIDEDKLKEL